MAVPVDKMAELIVDDILAHNPIVKEYVEQFRATLQIAEIKYEDKQDIVHPIERGTILDSEYIYSPFNIRYATYRPCEDCEPNEGCNSAYNETYLAKDRPFVFLTEDEARLMKQKDWPAGTRLRILNVYDADISYVMNPNTLEEFKTGDVIETYNWPGEDRFNAHQRPPVTPYEPEWRNEYGGARIYGGAGVNWVPTTEAVTVKNLDKVAALRARLRVQYEARMVREAKEREEAARAETMKALIDARWNDRPITMPTVNWQAGESYMRMPMAWKMMRNHSACGNPLNYVFSFPEETPAAVIWHDYLANAKQSPNGRNVEWYWVTRIINYAPGAMREALKLIKQDYPNIYEADYIADHRLMNEKFREVFFHKALPWAKLEQRLREAGKYAVTNWELGLGPVTKVVPLPDRPVEVVEVAVNAADIPF